MLDYNLASIASQLGSTMNRKKTRIRLRRLNEQYAPTCGSKAPLYPSVPAVRPKQVQVHAKSRRLVKAVWGICAIKARKQIASSA